VYISIIKKQVTVNAGADIMRPIPTKQVIPLAAISNHKTNFPAI